MNISTVAAHPPGQLGDLDLSSWLPGGVNSPPGGLDSPPSGPYGGEEPWGRRWHMLALLLLVLAGITGNVLVCLAVCVERKLQNVTNYFLVSLAVADLFVSLVVMPGAIVQEFMGRSRRVVFTELFL